MAKKFLDMTGKTEEEALSKALGQLGLDRDDVSVEILERAKSGFFGLGASPAKVRVTYGLDEPEAVPAPPAPEKAAPAAPKAPAAPAAAAAGEPEKKGGPAPRAEERGERRRKGRGEKARSERRPTPQDQEEPTIPAPEALGQVCDDEKAQQIRAFLTGLLQHMDSAAEITIYQPEKGRYKVFLDGEKLGSLIGRRGETLDAIQQLTNYSVNRGSDKRVRVHVDAENYRLKREQSLQHLALKVAAKVVKYKRNVTLEPMNAYERHVIHTALQDVENVTTYSMGTEPNRRVIVSYDRDKKVQ